MESNYTFNYCDLCNKNEGEIKVKDGWICENCKNSLFGIYEVDSKVKKKSIVDLKKTIARNKELYLNSIFSETQGISNYLSIDDNNRLWCCPKIKMINGFLPKIFRIEELKDFQLVINNEAKDHTDLIMRSESGNLKAPIIDHMYIEIYTTSEKYSRLKLEILDSKIETYSTEYKNVMKVTESILNLLGEITERA